MNMFQELCEQQSDANRRRWRTHEAVRVPTCSRPTLPSEGSHASAELPGPGSPAQTIRTRCLPGVELHSGRSDIVFLQETLQPSKTSARSSSPH